MNTFSLTGDMIYKGNLVLVNRDHPYCEAQTKGNFMPIRAVMDDVILDSYAARAYTSIMEELCAWDKITAVSGWRSREEQERIYNDSLKENGEDFTAKYVAVPGHSEHQTGFALDLALALENIDFLTPHFPHTGVCADFRKLAGRYGFVERYPEGKEGITGIAHEPWHFRYVGAPHAMLMDQFGDTLEEYHERLKQFVHGSKPLLHDFGSKRIEISYLAAGKRGAGFAIEDDAICKVSGNNMDGFIITVWKDKD